MHVGIGRQRGAQFEQDAFGEFDFANFSKRLGKSDGVVLILGLLLPQNLQRHHRSLRHLQGVGRIGDDAMRGTVVRVRVEDLFRDGHGFRRVFAERHLRLGDLRRCACAAENFLEETAGGLAGLASLSLAQRLAHLDNFRHTGEHLHQQINGVIKIFAREGVVRFGEQRTHFTRNIVHSFFRHGGGI